MSPIILFSDPSFIGFFFIGAIQFFETEQRVTEAIFSTPVTIGGPPPPLSPGLVMVSAKVMVRPPNFGGENPQKSQKDEHRNGTIFFYQNLTKRAPIILL